MMGFFLNVPFQLTKDGIEMGFLLVDRLVGVLHNNDGLLIECSVSADLRWHRDEILSLPSLSAQGESN
ncbi:unnamed protein product [Calypogeia fissa]